MESTSLSILVVDKNRRSTLEVIHGFFFKYGNLYDLIIFPRKRGTQKDFIKVIFRNSELIPPLENLFSVKVDCDIESMEDAPPFFEFDLKGVEKDAFYEILGPVITTDLSTL